MTTPGQFDARWAAGLAEFCAGAYSEYAAMEPGSATQADSALAADYALDCALVSYALGASPHDVRLWIARAAYALGEVFRLRGTSTGVPSVVLTAGGVGRVTAAGGRDDSLTNSRRGLAAMYTALVAGDAEFAERTASMVGDPPGASYLGPHSAVCTPEEQQLAYAVKALVLGHTEDVSLRPRGLDGSAAPIRYQAAAVRAIAGRSPQRFLDALGALLAAHGAEAADARNAREPRYFLSLPGLGLAALATMSGLVAHRQLPSRYPHFAVQLLRPDPAR